MKKIISIFLSLCIAVSLAACGNSQSESNSIPDENITDNSISTENNNDGDINVADLVYPWGLTTKPMRACEGFYPYETVCYSDPTQKTTGHVMITDYTTAIDSENPEYEIKTVNALMVFDDANAQTFGMSYNILCNSMEHETFYQLEDKDSITIDGKEYDIELLNSGYSYEGWIDYKYYAEYTVSYRVPAGYDELALVFYNAKYREDNYDENNKLKDGTPIANLVDENTNWFIMGGIPDDSIWNNDAEYKYTPTYNNTLYETKAYSGVEYEIPDFDSGFDVDAEDHDYYNNEDYNADTTIYFLNTNQDHVDRNDANWICANLRYEGAYDGCEFIFTVYSDSSEEPYYTYSFIIPSDSGSCSVDFEINGADIPDDFLYLSAVIIPVAGNSPIAMAETALLVE